MHKSGHGLILGKFLPPHAGHLYLADFARNFAERLTILVCSLPGDPIPGELRYAWMRELFPAARVIHIDRELPQEPGEHPRFWDIWRDVVTSADFVRGWRRAMEPGTAMDYVGFFLDNVAGARAYYEFRNDAVRVLTALRRLARGETPDALGLAALGRAGNLPDGEAAGVDWAALHARATARAVPLLRRRTVTWWQILGARSQHTRNTLAAAAVVLLLLTGVLMPERPAAGTVQPAYRTIEEELALSVPYSSVPLLAGDADNGAVIDALLLYDREEW